MPSVGSLVKVCTFAVDKYFIIKTDKNMTTPTNKFIRRADRKPLNKNKLFYGAYLNMAQHNAFLILQDVSEKMRQKPPQKEANLRNTKLLSLLKKANTDKPPRLSTLSKTSYFLLRYLIAFESLVIQKEEGEAETQPDAGLLADILDSALGLLDDLRNEHSHYYHETETEVRFGCLLKIFNEAKRIATERLPQDDEKALNHNTKKIAKMVLSEDEKLIFFICLFLEKRQAEQFMTKIDIFKGQHNTLKRKVFAQCCCRLPRPKLESAALELDALNELARCPKEIFGRLSADNQQLFVADIQELNSMAGEEIDIPEHGNKITLRRYEDRLPRMFMRYLDEKTERFNIRFQVLGGRLRAADYQKEIYGIESDRNIHENLTAYMRLHELLKDDIPEDWKDKIKQPDNDQLPDIEQYSPHYHIVNNRIAIKFQKENKVKINLNKSYYSQIHTPRAESVLKYKVMHPLADAILSTHEIPHLFLYQYLYQKDIIKNAPDEFIKEYIDKFRQVCEDVKANKFPKIDITERFEKQTRRYRKDKRDDLEERRLKLQKELDKKYAPVRVSHLPNALREYLLYYEADDINKLAVRKIDAKIEDAIKRRGNAEHGKGTEERELKSGNIGTYLARDIVFFQPLQSKSGNNEDRGKPNNDEYNELQKAIAYFGKERFYIKAYLEKELGILGERNDPKKHPFLAHLDWNQCKTSKDFYSEYLRVKKDWLKAVKNDIRKKPKEMKSKKHWDEVEKNCRRFGIKVSEKALSDKEIEDKYGYFLNLRTKPGNQRNYLKTIKKDKATGEPVEDKNAPVILPRGLFNDAIREALKAKYSDINDESGMTHFTEVLMKNEPAQSFYDYNRHYEFDTENERLYRDKNKEKFKINISGNTSEIGLAIKDLKADIRANKDEAKYLSEGNKYEKRQAQSLYDCIDIQKHRWRKIYRSEQAIRTAKYKDRLLWLMIKDIFEKRSQEEKSNMQFDTWVLANVGFDVRNTVDDWILNKEVPIQLTLHEKEVIANTTSVEADKAQDDRLSVKRYGEFRRLLKDRRLWSEKKENDNILYSGIFQYYPANKILWTTIQTELRYYDDHRHEFIETVFDFEQKLLKHPTCQADLMQEKDVRHIDHTKMLLVFEQHFNFPYTAIEVSKLRNALMHNEVPYQPQWLSQYIQTSDSNSWNKCQNISRQIIEFAEEIYKSMIRELEQNQT